MIRVRTGYSFREAAGSIEDVVSRLVEIGAEHAPITDRASTFGFHRWEKAAKAAGMKPVFGVELAVTRSISEAKPTTDHWVFLAKDDLSAVNRLVERATMQFRYQPLLTYDEALAAPGVIRLAGHKALLEGLEPAPDTFLGLSPASAKGQVRRALAAGWKLAATGDNRYPREGDRGFYEVLTGRNAQTQSYPQHILSEAEWRSSVAHLGLPTNALEGAAFAARNALASCSASLSRAEILKPPRPKPLRQMCEEGATALGVNLEDETYRSRLDRELTLIEEKNFEDYFYLVADLCVWARERMIVGPARGSSCGSLVCYLLRITTVDPIPFGLIFERFIDVNRDDLPDIDIDFSDQQRFMVFDYLRKKYGPERVARLGTVALFKPRSALQECGTALRVPRWKCDAVSESLIERSSGDARALFALEDTLESMPAGRALLADHPEMRIATRFEGHPRHYCLKGDTPVRIGQTGSNLAGAVRIDELHRRYVEDPSPDARQRKSMPWLVSMEDDERCRKQRAVKIWFAGVKPCVRMTFANGEIVECTREHRFLIDGEWKPCGEAGIGAQFRRTKVRTPGGKKGWPVGSKRPDMANPPGGAYAAGEAHANFRHGRAALVREQRASFAGATCQDCGAVPGEDLHHEDLVGGTERPHDVAWLCKSCHRTRHKGDGKRWTKGIETTTVALVSVEEIGEHPTFDIEMPVHHNFVLGNGIVASNSQHAAGVVIAERPVSDFVAIDHRTGATMCDKKDAEAGYNLLKIDALGLTQLSVFEDALELAGLPRDHLEKLPLDDPKSFAVLNRQHWSGIFQFNGMALQSITKQFTVANFNDIVSITALGRPGPLASGGAHEWVRRRNGDTPTTYPHPIFEPYLRDTLGVVLYQEQVMEIGRQVGDLSWGQVTALRKAMSKSLGKEYFDQFGDPWKAGAVAKGVDPAKAEKVWDDLCAYGSWSFNKSHSVAYGLISYWCCWLKAHHPFEFAAATLSHEPDPEKQIQILREMRDEGFGYVPVDPDVSTDKWTVGWRKGEKVLVGPLSNVKGVGPKMIQAILGARARGERPPDRARKLLENPVTAIDSLWPIRDAFRRVMPDPLERNIVTPPTPIKDVVITGEDYTAVVFCVLKKINPRDENEAVQVARRGGKEITDGLTASLNLQLADDTDTIFGKVTRYDYERLGREVVERGRVGKTLYAVKGRVRGGGSFRMMTIQQIKCIGDLDVAR